MRIVDDIPTGDFNFPDAGKHACKCTEISFETSKSKGTQGLKLTWITLDGESQFSDTLWITAKALGRLALIVKRLIPGGRELEVNDDDAKAVKELAEFIHDNIQDVEAMIEIVAYQETFIHESGDKIGQKETRDKKRVAFAGYEAISLGLEAF